MLPHGHLVRTLPAQTRPSAASSDRARCHDRGLDRTIQVAHHDDHREDVVSTVRLQPASPATTPRPPAPTIMSPPLLAPASAAAPTQPHAPPDRHRTSRLACSMPAMPAINARC
ncbi:hypothetical protein ACLOJK_027287 [Asimina triloba]